MLCFSGSSSNSDRHLRRQIQETTTDSSHYIHQYSKEDYELLITPSSNNTLDAIAIFPHSGYQVISLWDGDCVGDSPANITVPGRSDVSVKISGAEGLSNETISLAIAIPDYQWRSHSNNFLETSTNNGKICIELMTIGKYSAMGEEDKAMFVHVFNFPVQQSSSTLQAYQGVVLCVITVLAAILLIVACKQRTKTQHVHPDVPQVNEDFNKTFKETTTSSQDK